MNRKTFIKGITCAIVTQSIYGFSIVVAKDLTEVLNPCMLIACRFTFAFIILNILAAAGAVKISFRHKNIKSLLLIGILDPAIYYVCETFGLKMTTAIEGSMIIACIPVVSIICSSLILKKKPSSWQTAGIAVATAGVIGSVAAKGGSASLNIAGYVLLFTGVLSYSLYSVASEHNKEFSSAEKTYGMLAIGTAVFVPLAIVETSMAGQSLSHAISPLGDITVTGELLFLAGVVSVGAFFLNNKALELVGTNATSSTIGFATVMSFAAGILWLGEEVVLLQAVSIGVVLCGVYIAIAKDIWRKDG